MGFKKRDKAEIAIATSILFSFLFIEIFNIGQFEYDMLLRLMVITALLAIFGDNVAKAREMVSGGTDE